MDSLEDALDISSALVFGVGGGGDIVGCIPTARLLERNNVEVTLGGIAWERAPIDDKPGPRSLDEVENLDRVNSDAGYVNHDTETHDGLRFTETTLSTVIDNPIALIDITDASSGVTNGVNGIATDSNVDAVIGVDAGGDILAFGDEPGIQSPLCDGISLCALEELDRETCLGVFGMGSDGELTQEELNRCFSVIAGNNGYIGAWGLTTDIQEEMLDVLDVVTTTESSKLPVLAAMGELGKQGIRGGERDVQLTMASTLTYYFKSRIVIDESRIAELLRGTTDIHKADELLRRKGYTTEFTAEEQRLERRD